MVFLCSPLLSFFRVLFASPLHGPLLSTHCSLWPVLSLWLCSIHTPMALETKTTSLLQISPLISPGCLLSIFTCVTIWGLEFSLLPTEATITSLHYTFPRSLLLYMAPRGLDQWRQKWTSYPQQLSFTPTLSP